MHVQTCMQVRLSLNGNMKNESEFTGKYECD